MKPVREWNELAQLALCVLLLPVMVIFSGIHEFFHVFGISHGKCWFLGFGMADYGTGVNFVECSENGKVRKGFFKHSVTKAVEEKATPPTEPAKHAE